MEIGIKLGRTGRAHELPIIFMFCFHIKSARHQPHWDQGLLGPKSDHCHSLSQLKAVILVKARNPWVRCTFGNVLYKEAEI